MSLCGVVLIRLDKAMRIKSGTLLLIAAALTEPAIAQQDPVSITAKGESCQIKLLKGPGHERWAAVDCMTRPDARFYYFGVKCAGRGPSTLYLSNASTLSSIETLLWQRGGDNIYDIVATTICNMRDQER
jgi:hypothetical protein